MQSLIVALFILNSLKLLVFPKNLGRRLGLGGVAAVILADFPE